MEHEAQTMIRSSNAATVLYVLTGSLVVLYTLCAAIVGPSMYSDQGIGFLALRTMLQGGPFNEIVMPDPADISRNTGFFVAWWSPGQYMVPGLFRLLGFDIGQSITIVLFLSAAVGLYGLHLLYRRWGFPPLSSALTLFLLAGSRLFSHQFDIYGGGEVLLTAATPWFVLLLYRLGDMTPARAVVLFLAIAGMTFLKLSGLVFAVASVGSFVLIDLLSRRPGTLRRLVLTGLPFVAFAVLFQVFWLSRGETPTTVAANVFSPERLLTHAIPAVVACFTSILSAGDFAAALLKRPGYEILETLTPFYLAAAIPVAVVAWLAGRRLMLSHPDYARFAAILTAIFFLIMTAVHVRGGEVSVEDRHSRQIGLVLAIGVVHVVMQWPRPLRFAAAGLALVLMVYGGLSFVDKLRRNMASAKSDLGFRHMVLSQQALDFIRAELDTPVKGSALVVIPSAEVALEFKNRRTLEIPANFLPPEWIPRRFVLRGHVDHLGVLIQTKLVESGTAAQVLAAFRDYPADKWIRTPLGDNTYFSQDR